ncbi:MAG: hypothetical protein QNJ78_07205, partial [Gammaproteobacteria bacterium]|nr:hypothetical protein [Gammaproteobacteria bacterium]
MKMESKRQTVEKGLEKTGHGLGWYWLLAVVSLIVITIGVWSAIYYQFQLAERSSNLGQIQAGVQGVAGRLSQVNLMRKKVLNSLASEPALSALMQRGAAEEIAARENHLRHALPGVLRVRLLPVGLNEPDTSAVPHMGFASIAQLRLAEKRTGVLAAEVHQFKTPHQYISFVVGVRAQGTGPLAGLIHAAFPVEELRTALESVSDYGGRVAIRQKAPDANPFVLVQTIPEGPQQSAPDGSLPIDGSIWQVDYWASPPPLISMHNGLILIAAATLVVLLSVLWALLVRSVASALKRDQRNVLSLVESLLVGRPPKRQSAKLGNMQPMIDVLYHQIKEHRVNVAKLNKATTSFGVPDTGVVVAQQAGSPLTMPAVSAESVELAASIFRAYDIRGVVGETLNKDVMNLLGQSIGSEIYEQNLQSVVVGR